MSPRSPSRSRAAAYVRSIAKLSCAGTSYRHLAQERLVVVGNQRLVVIGRGRERSELRVFGQDVILERRDPQRLRQYRPGRLPQHDRPVVRLDELRLGRPFDNASVDRHLLEGFRRPPHLFSAGWFVFFSRYTDDFVNTLEIPEPGSVLALVVSEIIERIARLGRAWPGYALVEPLRPVAEHRGSNDHRGGLGAE